QTVCPEHLETSLPAVRSNIFLGPASEGAAEREEGAARGGSVVFSKRRRPRRPRLASVPTSRLTGDRPPICCCDGLPAFRKPGRLHSRYARPAQAEALFRDGRPRRSS